MIEKKQADPKQVSMLRLRRVVRDGKDSEFWKEMTKLVQDMIVMRERLICTPLHELPNTFQDGTATPYGSMDLQGRAAAMESVKGALIALRLILSLPDTIIADTNGLAEEFD